VESLVPPPSTWRTVNAQKSPIVPKGDLERTRMLLNVDDEDALVPSSISEVERKASPPFVNGCTRSPPTWSNCAHDLWVARDEPGRTDPSDAPGWDLLEADIDRYRQQPDEQPALWRNTMFHRVKVLFCHASVLIVHMREYAHAHDVEFCHRRQARLGPAPHTTHA